MTKIVLTPDEIVLIPSRVVGDSDHWRPGELPGGGWVLIPSRVVGDSDVKERNHSHTHYYGLNTLSGSWGFWRLYQWWLVYLEVNCLNTLSGSWGFWPSWYLICLPQLGQVLIPSRVVGDSDCSFISPTLGRNCTGWLGHYIYFIDDWWIFH